MNGFSLQRALLVYTILFAILTSPYWIGGEVIAPYRQTNEIAAAETVGPRLENRKFSDYFNGYVPELHGLLDGRRSGWLALWTNQNELGRPLYHLSGFSPAYTPTVLIAAVSDSPERFITILSLSTAYLAGLFLLLYCHELGMAPLAGLMAGGSFAALPLFMYWLTFPMFPAVWCWSAGALYAVSRMARQCDLPGWALLAFCAYSLLIMAYPQPVVYHAYIVGGYVLYLASGRGRSEGLASSVRYLGALFSALAVGAALAAPVLLDVARTAVESVRITASPSFFLQYLPVIDSATAGIRFVALTLYPEVFGNPVSESFPLPYDGLSITPVLLFLGCLGLFLRFRQAWGWGLAIIVVYVLTLSPKAYLFGVKHLGFSLSPSTPLGSIMLPLAVLAAFGADALVRHASAKGRNGAVILGATALALGLALTVWFAQGQGLPIRWETVALALLALSLLVAQLGKTRPVLLVAALVVAGIYSSFPLMLRQIPSTIAMDSPLVDTMKRNLPADTRYAVLTPGVRVLPPNLNASLGLPSIHSYNSLSSRRYHTLLQALEGKSSSFGRWNDAIQPNFSGPLFWMSNIALVLSPSVRDADKNLEYLGPTGGVHLYRVMSRMGCCWQMPFAKLPGSDDVQVDDPRNQGHPVVKTVDEGDVVQIDVQRIGPSLLILSQKFHRDWQAQVLTASGWRVVATAPVNGVFQGVMLPDGASQVRLQFLPFARFAWIAHAFWLFVLTLLVVRYTRQRNQSILANKGA